MLVCNVIMQMGVVAICVMCFRYDCGFERDEKKEDCKCSCFFLVFFFFFFLWKNFSEENVKSKFNLYNYSKEKRPKHKYRQNNLN